jgi:anti-sigma factor RsiW
MEHLSPEALARLVDEAPTPDERGHIATCTACAAEVEVLREQTRALGSLPELMPPRGDWRVLEARLRSEGLVEDPGVFRGLGLAQTPVWMKAAAAVLLFLGGTGTGAALTAGPAGSAAQVALSSAEGVEEAASAVRVAEQQYVDAVSQYRQLLAAEGGESYGSDPMGRFAALEHLVMVSQAAVRQAPGDPFLNGFLASAMAERDVAARMVSTRQDNWF